MELRGPANLRIREDYEPMWKFLENLDKKKGIHTMQQQEIWKHVFTFARTAAMIELGIAEDRIKYLTEQNIKWCNRALDAEKVVEVLKQQLETLSNEAKNLVTLPIESQSSSES